jgi:hypothetical protein
MAEIKNNFLSSKMNQDIDDRLMTNNEYRYAMNLQVNRSEGSDVGSLQNVLGNSLAVDFRAVSGINDIQCIGVLADDSNSNIYVFLTNNTGSLYNASARNYIYVYNNKQTAPTATNPTLLVTGPFLNFSTLSPIYGINLIENLLFWTDNRNQPRRIDVTKANTQNLAVPTYYTIEEQISVAQLSPLGSPELFTLSELSEETGKYETTMYDRTSPELPNGTANPYYQEFYPGDPVYLESKYVRFSYRYKFEGNEYSIMAPFTQIAYIPRQDGYFRYEPPISPSAEPALDDETSAYRSTIVSFMQNKVNNILLQIELPYKPEPITVGGKPVYVPCQANELYSIYKIVEIEILYKEAEDLAIKVIDSIPTIPEAGSFWNTTATVYTYNYQSKKPFKTLPSDDTTRVYDKTPVKALSQEIAGNRVIYGNYQDKFTYPKYLNYNAGYSQKFPFGFDNAKGTSIVEYPNHSIKQNRNYQIGIILCDKFGRQSGVILSDLIQGDEEFGASTLYVPYLGENEISTPFNWPGSSLKVLFNEKIQPEMPNATIGWPGIYNGNKLSPNYNPLGWYSYKIVVKQTEQDYYNVYLPGVMASYPENTTLELGKTSHAVLINDNINKVPRDLSEVGPGQKQFRSSVILYPRVNNNILDYNNQQFYPGNDYAFVSTIATNNSLFFPNGVYVAPSPPNPYDQFYQIDSDPLIARISTQSKLGVASNVASPITVINLAVYETKPIESKLDIYWETSTTGLISDLNIAIDENSAFSVSNIVGWTFFLTEANGPGTDVSGAGFYFTDIAGAPITPTSVTIESVLTSTSVNVTSKFLVENIPGGNRYRIRTTTGSYFYYGGPESYTFTIKATVGSPIATGTFAIENNNLTNIAPAITNKPVGTITKAEGDIDVYDFNGVNGSNAGGGNENAGLAWSVTGSPLFTITNTGVLKNEDGSAEGNFTLLVTLKDAGNLEDTVTVNVSYPLRQSFTINGMAGGCTGNGGGINTVDFTGTIDVVGNGWEVQVYIVPDTFSPIPTFSNTKLSIYDSQGTLAFFASVSSQSDNPTYGLWLSLSPGNYTYDLEITAFDGGACGGFFYQNV